MTFIYHAASNEITEIATLEGNKTRGQLRTYTCHPSCKEVWKDGEEVAEGKDYYIKPVDENGIKDIRGVFTAYPLTQQESEEELWAAMFKQLGFNVWRQVDIDQLKHHFTISRKTTQR